MLNTNVNKCDIVIMERYADKTELFHNISRLEKRIVPSLTSHDINILDYTDKVAENAVIIEIREKNVLSGLAAVYVNDIENQVAFLTFIAVDERFEGKGYGSLLLANVEKVARENYMKQIVLEVSAINIRAQQFYEKNGYEYTHHKGNSIFMRKLIEDTKNNL